MKTPMSSDMKLMKDEECESVDSTKYRGMIGSFLYLTASRPDIMFSVCLCARFQEAPKTSHLEAVKHIFLYIKGTMHLGLWYPKGTDIETIVYADSDHARDYVDQRALASTIVGGLVAKGITSIVTSSSSGMISINSFSSAVYLFSSIFCFLVLSCSNLSSALFELPSTKSVLKSTNMFTLLKALSDNSLIESKSLDFKSLCF
ncbi:hypothetical protein Tco_0556493 [Tanacetum coccineum]